MRNQRGYGHPKKLDGSKTGAALLYEGQSQLLQLSTPIYPKFYAAIIKQWVGNGWKTWNGADLRISDPGNVWVDIQQVFYRMEENVPGAYAQKPLKAVERIIAACSRQGDWLWTSFPTQGQR